MKVKEETRGFAEDIALRERYQKEGFGLETVFEKQEWAEKRILEIKESYGINDSEVRLVKHISSSETGQKPSWEIYVKTENGLRVLSLKYEN